VSRGHPRVARAGRSLAPCQAADLPRTAIGQKSLRTMVYSFRFIVRSNSARVNLRYWFDRCILIDHAITAKLLTLIADLGFKNVAAAQFLNSTLLEQAGTKRRPLALPRWFVGMLHREFSKQFIDQVKTFRQSPNNRERQSFGSAGIGRA
jgi:hypothetical protein